MLTPFGRDEMFSLGVAFRTKYGALLARHPSRKPVFRTESRDRMLKSSLNFAAGFFGIPHEMQYHQLVFPASPTVNNTLAPRTCPNAHRHPPGLAGRDRWRERYLRGAVKRLQGELKGVRLISEDVLGMQELCAYEWGALGGSRFCGLFTEDEWRGFGQWVDLEFWWRFGFGHPAAGAVGLG